MLTGKIWELCTAEVKVRVAVLLCLVVGMMEGFRILFHMMSLFYRYCLRPGLDFKKFGEWVVVTGATDGIGKAYCEQMAARGMNIFMLSRTPNKLAAMGEELTAKYGVKTNYLAVDFGQVSRETWNQIREEMDRIDVAVLVNNVGCSYDHYEFVHNISDATVDSLIEINIRSTIQMTRCVLPGMVDRKRGVVICIGSGVGSLLPSGPLLSVYAGTKAFVEQFVKSCSAEYKGFNITFQDQAPLFVATKMSKIRKERLSVPSPTRWVASAIGGINYDVVTPGYWYHSIMWMILQRMPDNILTTHVRSQGIYLRSRALAKKGQSDKKAT